MHCDSLVVAIRYIPTVDIMGTERVHICYSLHGMSCGCFVSPWMRFCDNSGGQTGLSALYGGTALKFCMLHRGVEAANLACGTYKP